MTLPKSIGTLPRFLSVLTVMLAFTQTLCHAQQDYVGRYDVYAGFSDLYTPALNDVNQPGFHLQAGINVNRWLASGFDYSVESGSTNLTAGLLKQQLQEELGAELPPGYVLSIPTHISTQTFTLGPQLEYRHFNKLTLFVRPSLAAFHLVATPHPTDPVATLVSEQLAPSGQLSDWVGVYGFGGGAQIAASKHLGIRMQYDGVWNHPFNSLLANGNWTNRFSIGPTFNFGKSLPVRIRK
jgi:hypothetical protein